MADFSDVLSLASQLAEVRSGSTRWRMVQRSDLNALDLVQSESPTHQSLQAFTAMQYGLEDEDTKQWQSLFKKSTPPDGYVCFSCFQPGHYIQHCNKEVPATHKITPYQGAKACVGEFKCVQCKRAWVSRRSMANLGQKCRRCRQWVFPKKQYAEDVALKCGIFEKELYKTLEPEIKWSESDGMTDSSYSTNSSGSKSRVSSAGSSRTVGSCAPIDGWEEHAVAAGSSKPTKDTWSWALLMGDYQEGQIFDTGTSDRK